MSIARQWPAHMTASRVSKSALILGYIGYLIAVVSIYFDRTTGYEVSIYTATTPVFWGGMVVAAVVSISILLGANNRLFETAAVALLGGSVVSIFALPLLRGYYFYGQGDSLIHLGWVRDMADGLLVPTDLLYPASHLLSVLLSETAGIEVTQAMMLVTLVFKLLFVLFVPLGLYVLNSDRRMVIIGVVSALLFLPPNHISTHTHFHTFSLAVLFTPFIYYLMFAHVTDYFSTETLPEWISPTALLFPFVLFMLVILHPQVAFNILLIFGTVVGVQIVYRRRTPDHPISQFRGLHAQFALLVLLFFVWAGQFENLWRTVNLMITSVQDTIVGTEPPGQGIDQRSQSSDEIGVNLTELFVKLFGVSFVYSVLAGGVVLTKLSDRFSETVTNSDGMIRFSKTVTNADGMILYFAYSGVVLGPFIGLHFLGDIEAYLFRHIGFIMVIVTLLGSLALYRLTINASKISIDIRPVIGAVVLIFLTLSMFVAFMSPYILTPNGHVTETEVDGYDTLFETQNEVPVLGVRDVPFRFEQALQYEDRGVVFGDLPNETVFNEGLWSTYDTDQYLAVSAYDQQREVEAYGGVRYSQDGFERLETTGGIHRVQANGDLTVYYLVGAE